MQNDTTISLQGEITLELRQGNIALQDVDAVVNAANEYLNLGSGVAGAIIANGGDSIQRECNEIGFCPVGSAVITSGGKLNARHVIHAVGPMYGEGNEDSKLRSAVQSALKLADDRAIKSIAFPAISAGFFHYPIAECAKVMVSAIKDAAPTLKNVKHVMICLSSDKNFDAFKHAIAA